MQNLVFWNILQEFESDSLTLHLVWRNLGTKHISSGGLSGNLPSITLSTGKEISLPNSFYGNYLQSCPGIHACACQHECFTTISCKFPSRADIEKMNK